MKFHLRTKRPLCQICKAELVTPDDLPHDEYPWGGIETDWLCHLDETNWREAKHACCTACFYDPMHDKIREEREWRFSTLYVAERYEHWRKDREVKEETKLKRWNEDMKALQR